MKRLDLPPLWLAFFLLVAWSFSLVWQTRVEALVPIGRILVALGIAVAFFALLELLRYQTPVRPQRRPIRIVTTGVYQFSRNPIYLGDAMILAGGALLLDGPLALILVPMFVALINKRFILREERRLSRLFPDEYRAWSAKTRRWL